MSPLLIGAMTLALVLNEYMPLHRKIQAVLPDYGLKSKDFWRQQLIGTKLLKLSSSKMEVFLMNYTR